ncbi:MAG: TLD domain-containing protein [archaeon]|nr:TLD domain-containing protein [archaeon]
MKNQNETQVFSNQIKQKRNIYTLEYFLRKNAIDIQIFSENEKGSSDSKKRYERKFSLQQLIDTNQIFRIFSQIEEVPQLLNSLCEEKKISLEEGEDLIYLKLPIYSGNLKEPVLEIPLVEGNNFDSEGFKNALEEIQNKFQVEMNKMKNEIETLRTENERLTKEIKKVEKVKTTEKKITKVVKEDNDNHEEEHKTLKKQIKKIREDLDSLLEWKEYFIEEYEKHLKDCKREKKDDDEESDFEKLKEDIKTIKTKLNLEEEITETIEENKNISNSKRNERNESNRYKGGKDSTNKEENKYRSPNKTPNKITKEEEPSKEEEEKPKEDNKKVLSDLYKSRTYKKEPSEEKYSSKTYNPNTAGRARRGRKQKVEEENEEPKEEENEEINPLTFEVKITKTEEEKESPEGLNPNEHSGNELLIPEEHSLNKSPSFDKNTEISIDFKTIFQWIDPSKNFQKRLLYKATRDSDKAIVFHSLCDNKGPTLSVIVSDNGSICGGYTSKNWDGSYSYRTDKEAFIFSLDNKQKYYPKEGKYAIYCSSNEGPSFGWGDLSLCDCFFSKENNHNQSYYYEFNTGELVGTPGEKYFKVKEVEVYQISSD